MKDKNSEKPASFIVRLKAGNEPKSVLGGKLFHVLSMVVVSAVEFCSVLDIVGWDDRRALSSRL